MGLNQPWDRFALRTEKPMEAAEPGATKKLTLQKSRSACWPDLHGRLPPVRTEKGSSSPSWSRRSHSPNAALAPAGNCVYRTQPSEAPAQDPRHGKRLSVTHKQSPRSPATDAFPIDRHTNLPLFT